MPFKGPEASGSVPESPELLYRELPHRPDAVEGLWLHQGDILRSYVADHLNDADLALELPTGTGKTLPGLLIADWNRRRQRARVAYACPTQQLARQVLRTAEREGTPAVLLVGSHKSWPVADQASYEAADAIAITTYSTIFNSSPKIAHADLLIFDDAHAGEQYVAGAYGVLIRRRDDPAGYLSVLDAIGPALDGMFLQRLREEVPDPGVHDQIRLVVPGIDKDLFKKLDAALRTLEGEAFFSHSMIRPGLRSCLVYATYSSILVRPLLPPTEDNAVFSAARQRVYLSATLGDGGELERSFGRSQIARLALPDTAPPPRSGRRFFVFADLIEDGDPQELARKIVAAAGKALVLTPDLESAAKAANALAQPGWPVFTRDDVETSLEPFAKAKRGVCGLANRYDGLDLPGDHCRVVLLEGKPDADSLQERFLMRRARAGSALAERVRTRVVQGAGRCTRGPNDWAIVVIRGPELTKYLLWPETQRALPQELQAEISFGVENSKAGTAEVLANVKIFLEQGDTWRREGEVVLADFRRAAERVPPSGSSALTKAAPLEIEACSLAWRARWAAASAKMQDAARAVGEGQDATRGYRAVLLYLAGIWAEQEATEANDEAARRTARDLIQQAEAAARPSTWTREMRSLPDEAPAEVHPEDAVAIGALAARIEKGVSAGKVETRLTEVKSGLSQTTASQYEQALVKLGALLGAESYKPSGAGRCDSAWCWGNALWLALEAKSEHVPSGVIPHKDLRQANDQLRLMASDRSVDAAPDGSATVLISPKSTIDPDVAPSAERHVHLTHPDDLIALARDTVSAWKELLAGQHGLDRAALRSFVGRTLRRHGVLPSIVRDRLTTHAVAGD